MIKIKRLSSVYIWLCFSEQFYVERLFKEAKEIERSNYFYEAEDKLFPEDELFFDNTTWTFSRKKQHKNKKERMLPNFKTVFLRNNNQKSFLKDN